MLLCEVEMKLRGRIRTALLLLGLLSTTVGGEVSAQETPPKTQKVKRKKPAPQVVKWHEDEGPLDRPTFREQQREAEKARGLVVERQKRARRLRMRYARNTVDGC